MDAKFSLSKSSEMRFVPVLKYPMLTVSSLKITPSKRPKFILTCFAECGGPSCRPRRLVVGPAAGGVGVVQHVEAGGVRDVDKVLGQALLLTPPIRLALWLRRVHLQARLHTVSVTATSECYAVLRSRSRNYLFNKYFVQSVQQVT